MFNLIQAARASEVWRAPKGAFSPILQLSGFGRVRVVEERQLTLTFFDDFSQQLCTDGKCLVQCETHWYLGSPSQLHVCPSSHEVFAREFSSAPFAAALFASVGMRKLLQVHSAEWSIRSIEVKDEENKTRVKLLQFQWDATRILFTCALRGYEQDHLRVCDLLKRADCKQSESPLLHTLRNESGFVHNPFPAKPVFTVPSNGTLGLTVCAMAAELIANARRCEHGILTAPDDIEFLHDFRVNLRRTRALLAVASPAFSPNALADLKSRLATIMGKTGELRDLDVFMSSRTQLEDLVPPTLRSGLPAMFSAFSHRHAETLHNVQNFLTSKQYQIEIAHLYQAFLQPEDGLFSAESSRPVGEAILTRLVKRTGKVLRAGTVIQADTPDEQVHELRIECKKLRYLLEFFGSLLPDDIYPTLRKALKSLQDILGDFNDCSVQQASLTRYLEDITDVNQHQSVGALVQALYQRQLHYRQRVEGGFAEFESYRPLAVLTGVQRQFAKENNK